MKCSKIVMSGCVVAALALGESQLAFGPMQPEKAPAGKPPAMPDFEKMMEEMEKYRNPGPEHEVLKGMVGTWDCAAKFFMPGPDGAMQEMTSKGEATFTSELGGRWIRQDFKGDMMGESFAGFGHTGYDKMKKQYFATWADTMSTSMLTMTGDYDKATKTINMTGSCEMPGVGLTKMRHTVTHKGPDSFVFTMYSDMGQGETRDGEIVYTRRK